MTTRPTLRMLAALCLLCALEGCAVMGRQAPPQDSNKFTVGDTDRFVAQDPATEAAVGCTGLQERTLADGRLEVVANVKNRGPKPVQVRIACAFADEQFAPVGGEPGWGVLKIAGDATEVVRFTAPSAAARRYAIRVRDAR